MGGGGGGRGGGRGGRGVASGAGASASKERSDAPPEDGGRVQVGGIAKSAPGAAAGPFAAPAPSPGGGMAAQADAAIQDQLPAGRGFAVAPPAASQPYAQRQETQTEAKHRVLFVFQVVSEVSPADAIAEKDKAAPEVRQEDRCGQREVKRSKEK